MACSINKIYIKVMAIISDYKIDRVATILTESKSVEAEELVNEMSEIARQAYLRHVPKDVLTFVKKYPAQTSVTDSWFFRPEGFSHVHCCFLRLGLPNMSLSFQDVILEGSKEEAALRGLLAKRRMVLQERLTLENKVKCVLSKLRTYKKIEKDFPAAYKVLIEQVDGLGIVTKSGSLCDDVESLRAVLTSNK